MRVFCFSKRSRYPVFSRISQSISKFTGICASWKTETDTKVLSVMPLNNWPSEQIIGKRPSGVIALVNSNLRQKSRITQQVNAGASGTVGKRCKKICHNRNPHKKMPEFFSQNNSFANLFVFELTRNSCELVFDRVHFLCKYRQNSMRLNKPKGKNTSTFKRTSFYF